MCFYASQIMIQLELSPPIIYTFDYRDTKLEPPCSFPCQHATKSGLFFDSGMGTRDLYVSQIGFIFTIILIILPLSRLFPCLLSLTSISLHLAFLIVQACMPTSYWTQCQIPCHILFLVSFTLHILLLHNSWFLYLLPTHLLILNFSPFSISLICAPFSFHASLLILRHCNLVWSKTLKSYTISSQCTHTGVTSLCRSQ